MWRNALVATITVLTGFILLALSEIDYLMPYKHYLLARYGTAMLVYLGLLAVNLFGLFFWTARKVLLKDTGRKLVHLEKQLRAGELTQDLGQRLQMEDGE